MLLSQRLVRVSLNPFHSYLIFSSGTSNFGILDVPLPTGAIMVSQILWGSIGWSVGKYSPSICIDRFLNKNKGSCLGAALAARDIGLPRVILFVGDGSL